MTTRLLYSSSVSELSALQDKFILENQDAIFGMMNNIWGYQIDELTRARVTQALTSGDFDYQFYEALTGTYEDLNFNYQSVMSNSMGNQGNAVAGRISEIVGKPVFFTSSTDIMKNYIDQQGARFVAEISSNQRESIQTILKYAIDNDYGIVKTANELKTAIQLTKKESLAVINAEKIAYNNAIRSLQEQGFSGADLQRRASKIAAKAKEQKKLQSIQNRRERIANTELVRAKNEADIESIRQSIEQKKINESTKTWRSTNRFDNWESSIQNNGITVAYNASFPYPNSNGITQYPAEINEKCILEYRVIY